MISQQLEAISREETPRTEAVCAAMLETMTAAAKGARVTADRLGELLGELSAAYTELGFQNGFRIGVWLMMEFQTT